MKKCIKCGVEKDFSEFSKRKGGTLIGECKSCRKEYLKKYRETNSTILSEKRRKRYLKNRSKEVGDKLRKEKEIEEERKYLLKIGKKKCNKCNKIKDTNRFSVRKANIDGFQRSCKCCDKEYRYEYSGKENQIKIKKLIDKRNYLFSLGIKECSACKKDKKIFEFGKNKSKTFGLNSACKKCSNKQAKRRREYHKEYYSERDRRRRKTDPLFKMKRNLRTRTWSAFKSKGYKKSSKTQKMLGVDWEVCKQHIEKQFTEGMNWDNQGEWHIDHIIPLASANNEKELMKLCHYRNLQPLWAEDNLSKKDKIQGQQTFMKL